MDNTVSMNAFQLKMLAISAMLMDHAGALFFPHILALRMIGRLSAPIMAFFIAEGYLKTRSVKKYGLRLLIFGIISMLPYKWVFGNSPFNILFDFFLGLVVIHYSQKLDKEYQRWGVVLAAALVAFLLQTDGRLGVSTLVYLFYRFRQDKRFMAKAMSLLYLGIPLIYWLYARVLGPDFLLNQSIIWLMPLSLLALLLILQYNGERGKSLKYWFYVFYPGHLVLLFFLKSLY